MLREERLVRRMMTQVENALKPFYPRPHWGGLFNFSLEAVASLYPKLSLYRELVEQHDPSHKFRGPFLSTLLAVRPEDHAADAPQAWPFRTELRGSGQYPPRAYDLLRGGRVGGRLDDPMEQSQASRKDLLLLRDSLRQPGGQVSFEAHENLVLGENVVRT